MSDDEAGEKERGDGEPIRVFEVRGVYLFVDDRDRSLPARVASRYNASADRYELPTRDLVEELAEAVDVTVVEDVADYQVTFPSGQVPGDVTDRAVFVEHRRTSDVALLPTPDAVDRAIEEGGQPVDEPRS